MRHSLAPGLLLAVLCVADSPANAQVMLADDVILLSKGQSKKEQDRTHEHLTAPGAGDSRLPYSPGAGVARLGEPTVVQPVPGVLSRAAAPAGASYGAAGPPRLAPPTRQPGQSVPLYGSLELPAAEEEGPPDGLTLDAAIDRLVQVNYDLRTKFQEIPKADADILSAGLRLNPILFASVDNLPYGNYSEQRPGAASYEVTVIQPLDVNQKRKDRVRVAQQAKRVLEAQYQDAVRVQIDNLYTAYVDVLDARETARAARAGVAGLAELVKVTRDLAGKGVLPGTDVDRAVIQQSNAEVALQAAEAALGQARRNLATLLAVPPQQADCLTVRAALRDRSMTPPCLDDLIRTAMASRPDLAAYRLGIQRAEAGVQLARAERFEDVFVFYTPYSQTNYTPQGKQDASSWSLGVMVPLPLYNRNQGNIARARLNVIQTRIELEGLERQVVNEVQRAAAECAAARAALERYERDILPAAQRLRTEQHRLFVQGQAGLVAYLGAQREYNDVVRQYLESLIRHRRSLLRLNTAVGERIVP